MLEMWTRNTMFEPKWLFETLLLQNAILLVPEMHGILFLLGLFIIFLSKLNRQDISTWNACDYSFVDQFITCLWGNRQRNGIFLSGLGRTYREMVLDGFYDYSSVGQFFTSLLGNRERNGILEMILHGFLTWWSNGSKISCQRKYFCPCNLLFFIPVEICLSVGS